MLIGMRGVGKTNIARRVCFLTKRPVMSTDVLVEYESGPSIPAVRRSTTAGRPSARPSTRWCANSRALDGLIIDAGGGILVDLDDHGKEVYSDRKVDLLKSGGTVVFLAGDIERLAAKVAGDPAAAGPRRPDVGSRR